MFDLEKSIAEWRKQMLAAGIKAPVPLEELESHLREEIERRVESGLDEPMAFEISVQQIGKANMLKNEFEKIDGAKKSLERKLIQVAFLAGLGVISLFFATCFLFKLGSCSDLSPAQQMSGLAALAAMILLAAGGYFCSGLFPAILNKQRRDAIYLSIGVLTMIWLAIFFYVILQRVEFTMSQLVVALLWGIVAPFGAHAGVVAGMENAARKLIAT